MQRAWFLDDTFAVGIFSVIVVNPSDINWGGQKNSESYDHLSLLIETQPLALIDHI